MEDMIYNNLNNNTTFNHSLGDHESLNNSNLHNINSNTKNN
jgi:hypothetical protein